MDVIINHGGGTLTECLGIEFKPFEKKVRRVIGEVIEESNKKSTPKLGGEEIEISGKVSNISQKILDNFSDAEILALATSLITTDVKENLERMNNPMMDFESFLASMKDKAGKFGAEMEVIKIPRDAIDDTPKKTNITLNQKKKDSES